MNDALSIVQAFVHEFQTLGNEQVAQQLLAPDFVDHTPFPGFGGGREDEEGLRASQKIYWGNDATAPGAFGLWWPWGDGTTISLRIGLHHLDEPKQRYPRLRDVFGIPQAPGPA